MQIIESILSLFYPRICFACGNSLYKNEEVICTHCYFRLPKTNFHLLSDNPVSRAFWGRIDIESAAAFLYFSKGGNIQKLMHQFKYKGRREIGVYLGKHFGYQLKKSRLFEGIDCIVPVPLHPRKQRMRGFNQSDQIARGLSEALHVRVNKTDLIRSRHSESQTKKTRYERWLNVGHIFRLKEDHQLQNKHVLLVDDVITTGATLEACAKTIKEGSNAKVSIATLAYADS